MFVFAPLADNPVALTACTDTFDNLNSIIINIAHTTCGSALLWQVAALIEERSEVQTGAEQVNR